MERKRKQTTECGEARSVPKGDEPIPEGRVRGQLETILTSVGFGCTKRGRAILRFVVEHTLGGRSSEVKGITIATQVLGRSERFDPSKDPIVSIEVRKLRDALETYYLGEGRSDPVEISIPKGGYVPRFRWRSMELSIADRLAAPQRIWTPSLVVRRFVNNTGDPSLEPLCLAIFSQIVILLTRHRTLSIRIGDSGTDSDSDSGGHAGDGDHDPPTGVLSGDVSRVGHQLGVGVFLEEVETRRCVWAERFSGALDSVDLAAQLARSIVAKVGGDHGAVNLHLVPAMRAQPPEGDPTTYEAMLAYYQFDRHRTQSNLREVSPLLHHASSNDPTSGLLKAMLGQTKIFEYAQSFSDDVGLIDEAFALSSSAVALEPENQFCIETQAWALFHLGQLDAALTHLERAYALDPDAPYRVALIGWDMMLCGSWERGRRILEGAMELNPSNPSWLWFAVCLDEFRCGRYGSALELASRQDLPNLFWVPLMRAAALGRMGETEKASKVCGDLVALRPEFGNRGKSMIGRLIKHRRLFDDILEGLASGGLTLS